MDVMFAAFGSGMLWMFRRDKTEDSFFNLPAGQ